MCSCGSCRVPASYPDLRPWTGESQATARCECLQSARLAVHLTTVRMEAIVGAKEPRKKAGPETAINFTSALSRSRRPQASGAPEPVRRAKRKVYLCDRRNRDPAAGMPPAFRKGLAEKGQAVRAKGVPCQRLLMQSAGTVERRLRAFLAVVIQNLRPDEGGQLVVCCAAEEDYQRVRHLDNSGARTSKTTSRNTGMQWVLQPVFVPSRTNTG